MKLLEKIISIKNKDNHKIIVILGIKLKINFKLLFQLKQLIFIPKYYILKRLYKNQTPACFIITKFNIAIKYNGYNNKKVEETTDIHLNDEYLAKRFQLFEKYYIPSLLNQTDKNFKFIVLFHPLTPEKYKNKIKTYEQLFKGNLIPLFVEHWDSSKITQTITQNCNDKKWIMTIRMDSDDGISEDFVELSKKYFCPINKMVISYYDRIQVLESPNTPKLYRFNHESWHYLAFIEKKSKNILTAFCGEHIKAIKNYFNFYLVKNRKKPMWLEVVHDFNVANMIADEAQKIEDLDSINRIIKRFNVNNINTAIQEILPNA